MLGSYLSNRGPRLEGDCTQQAGNTLGGRLWRSCRTGKALEMTPTQVLDSGGEQVHCAERDKLGLRRESQ